MESTMQMAAFPGTQAPASPESLSKTLSLAPVQQAPASMDVDFDLGGATPAETPSAGAAPDFNFDAPSTEAASDAGASLDFDIGGGDSDATVIVTPFAAAVPSADFAPGGTLIMGAGDASPEPAVDHSLDETQPLADVRPPDLPSPTIDFDFDLSADTPAAASAPAAAAAPAGNSMDFDLSGIDLDLPTSGASSSGDAPADDAATKLDLAKAYQDMGDKEGAKELLQEVLKEGNDAQKSEAQKLLSSIG
jgi:pilus assembly protein FimV